MDELGVNTPMHHVCVNHQIKFEKEIITTK